MTGVRKVNKKAQREGWHCCCHQKYRLQCLFRGFFSSDYQAGLVKGCLYTDSAHYSFSFWAQTNKTMTAIHQRQLKCLREPVYIKAFDTRVTNLICSTRMLQTPEPDTLKTNNPSTGPACYSHMQRTFSYQSQLLWTCCAFAKMFFNKICQIICVPWLYIFHKNMIREI